MADHGVRRLCVREHGDGAVLGIVSLRDLAILPELLGKAIGRRLPVTAG
jgi:CBS domain-containing protein